MSAPQIATHSTNLALRPADDTCVATKRLQLQQLAKEVRSLEKHASGAKTPQAVSTGCGDMDALLPAGGYEPGCVVEYLRSSPACGASHLAMAAAASAVRAKEGYLVVVDPQRSIYPPALLCHGLDLQQVIFVHPETPDDLLWAIDQSLRTSAVAAVIAECHCVDDRAARRLQLAAESGSSLAVLIRGLAARRSPTWAEVQWVVRSAPTPFTPPHLSSAAPAASRAARVEPTTAVDSPPFPSPLGRRNHLSNRRRLYVQLARVRGGQAGTLLRIDINTATGAMQASKPRGSGMQIGHVDGRERNRHDTTSLDAAPLDATRALRLAPQLAHPTHPSRRARTG